MRKFWISDGEISDGDDDGDDAVAVAVVDLVMHEAVPSLKTTMIATTPSTTTMPRMREGEEEERWREI